MAFRKEAIKQEKTDSRVSDEFESIFYENWPRVYSILVRMVGDPAEAEDLALEAFVKLYNRQPVETGGSIGGWLYRVSTRLGLNAIRGWARRQKYELQSGRLEWVSRQPENPAELFAGEEEKRLARGVLARMDGRKAHLLTLRYAGMSYREIAEILHVEPTSIGPLLVRAEAEFEKRFRSLKGEEG